MKDIILNLHLFDGEEGAAPAANGSDTDLPVITPQAKKSDKYANVKFGIQDEIEEVAHPQGDDKPVTRTLDDRRKAFQELIKGDDYKDVYAEEVQRIINRRFKETKELQKTVDSHQPIIDMMMSRYQIDGNNLDALKAAIESDEAGWERAADEAGMTVSQYKQFQKLQRENENLKRVESEAKSQAQAEAQAQKWYEEGLALKGKFPQFDFQQEINNPSFVNMLKAGIPVEHAYKTIHMDEIISGAIMNTAANVEKQVTDNIRAKGNRPSENGSTAQSAFVIKKDPSKFTREDMLESAARAKRGETIRFGSF